MEVAGGVVITWGRRRGGKGSDGGEEDGNSNKAELFPVWWWFLLHSTANEVAMKTKQRLSERERERLNIHGMFWYSKCFIDVKFN